jgi:hypothetical protein
MLDADPSLIDAKGCDACTRCISLATSRPHDAARSRRRASRRRDEDHDSTPVQWLIRGRAGRRALSPRPGRDARYLPGLALGDRELVARLIDANPRSRRVSHRAGTRLPAAWLPHRGGTIYQWTLAFNSYAHQIALLNGHADVFELLWARSDDTDASARVVCARPAR